MAAANITSVSNSLLITRHRNIPRFVSVEILLFNWLFFPLLTNELDRSVMGVRLGGKNKGNNKEVVESNLIYMYLFKDLKKDSY